jgi:predicted transcriptional regulator
MDDLSLVKAELEKLDIKGLESLALETDVPATTAAKIRSGETQNPRYKTVRALANYFRAKAQKDRRETDRSVA